MKIYRCVECKEYTMEKEHCGQACVSVEPAKYSPDDKYAELTRKAKEEERTAQGLI